MPTKRESSVDRRSRCVSYIVYLSGKRKPRTHSTSLRIHLFCLVSTWRQNNSPQQQSTILCMYAPTFFSHPPSLFVRVYHLHTIGAIRGRHRGLVSMIFLPDNWGSRPHITFHTISRHRRTQNSARRRWDYNTITRLACTLNYHHNLLRKTAEYFGR